MVIYSNFLSLSIKSRFTLREYVEYKKMLSYYTSSQRPISFMLLNL